MRAPVAEYVITDEQRDLHLAAERVAIYAVVPFMAYLVTRKQLPGWARAAAGLIGLGTLIVDGALILKWRAMR